MPSAIAPTLVVAGDAFCEKRLPTVGPAVFIGNVVVVGETFPDVKVERRALSVRADGSIARSQPLLGACAEKVVDGGVGDKSATRESLDLDAAVAAALGAEGGRDIDGAVSVYRLSDTQLLLPGFVDAHIHAPQYAFVGLGTDRPLMGPIGWLEHHAFPAERKLTKDHRRARAVFDACVKRTLRTGTTTALYFGTRDEHVTSVLAESCARSGQRAFVGRVAMDRHCPADYADSSAEAGVASSAASLDDIDARFAPLVAGALTPRFVPTCSPPLLRGLGELAARRPDVVVQSHASESIDEVEFTKFAEGDSKARDIDILDRAGLLRASAVMAHGVHLLPEEVDVLAKRGCAVAHCPLSNAFFANGSLDVMAILARGCKVCLGTDVAGGYAPSMLSAMRHAVVASREAKGSSVDASLCWRGALWLATAGGADALGLARRAGRLECGFHFDALIVDAAPAAGDGAAASCSPYEAWELTGDADTQQTALPAEALLERFLNLGDDRNVAAVFVAGRRVVGDAGCCACGVAAAPNRRGVSRSRSPRR